MIRRKPYDAEIEYLESTGTQWIDTGVSISFGDVIEVSIGIQPSTSEGGIYGSGLDPSSNSRYQIYNYSPTQLRTMTVRSDGINVVLPQQASFGIRREVVFDLENKITYVDGSIVAQNYTTAPSVRSAYLFARNCSDVGVSGVSDIAAARVWGLRHYKNSTLVRDLIPVRVGSVGYMYDRVSGQLFGNQGTGDFVLGPDVSDGESIMRLHNYPKSLSAKDYIQDGLVNIWDGIENAGWELHDPSATVWKDLSGNGYDLQKVSGVWNNDHISNSASSGFLFNIIDPFPVRPVTVEVVCKQANTTTGWIVGFSDSGGTAGRFLLSHSTGIYCINKVNGMFLPTSVNVTRTLTVVYANAAQDTSVDSLFINGARYVGSEGSVNYNWGHDGFLIVGSRGNGVSKFIGDIYSIRLYSRALTADEIAHNYAIDKERFGLP